MTMYNTQLFRRPLVVEKIFNIKKLVDSVKSRFQLRSNGQTPVSGKRRRRKLEAISKVVS